MTTKDMTADEALKWIRTTVIESVSIARDFERILADQLLVESLPKDQWGERIGRTLANAIAFRTAQKRLDRLTNDIKGTS